jgi:hypothetical protein
MNGHSRMGHARWWLGLVLASGLSMGAFALQSGPAEAAPVATPGALVGVTTQAYPSFFRISPNGKTLQTGVIALGMSCTSGGTFTTPDDFGHIRIAPNGKLHAGISIPPTAISGGGTYSGTDSMSAQLNRKRTEITGVWELQLSYTFADGTTDQCDSGPVRFADTR